MSDTKPRILVTGASGQLGRLVINNLLATLPASQIIAMARDPETIANLSARGVEVRAGDYTKPETLRTAFAGVDRLLLISSSEIGQRLPQHRNAIAAAKQAGVKLLVYTSILRADTSLLGLAEEHRRTEGEIRDSGIPFILLRNGWYTENYAASIPPALQYSAFLGSAGEGRISSAARTDYAEAAAAVLTSNEDLAGRIYELAGDQSYTLSQFAGEIALQSGKPVSYKNLPEDDYKAALIGAGLPKPVAGLIADSDIAASKGALFDDSHELSKLIGHPTTPFAATVASALKG